MTYEYCPDCQEKIYPYEKKCAGCGYDARWLFSEQEEKKEEEEEREKNAPRMPTIHRSDAHPPRARAPRTERKASFGILIAAAAGFAAYLLFFR